MFFVAQNGQTKTPRSMFSAVFFDCGRGAGTRTLKSGFGDQQFAISLHPCVIIFGIRRAV